MEAVEARINSFKKSKLSKGWPHPTTFKATPATLADAGFYFSPAKGDPDNVVCFMCKKELSGWEQDEEPFEIHNQKCPKCPWVIARCALIDDFNSDGEFVSVDATRLPNSKLLEKARLDTYGAKGKFWPHDASKTHNVTSKKMAKAGFVYTPQVVGDDAATCFYCELSLSGWDEDDDPLTEHRKRENRGGKPCPFFHVQLPAAQETAPKRVKSTAAARKTRSTKPAVPGIQPSDEEDDREMSAAAPPPKRRTKASVGVKSAPAPKTTKHHVADDSSLEEGDDTVAVAQKGKTKAKASIISKSAPTTKSTQSNVAVESSAEDEDELVAVAAPKGKKKGKLVAPSRSTKPASVESSEDEPDEPVTAAVAPKAKGRAKKSTTAKPTTSKASARIAPVTLRPNVELSDEEVTNAPAARDTESLPNSSAKPPSTALKTSARIASASSAVAPSTSSSKRSSRKPAAESDCADGEEKGRKVSKQKRSVSASVKLGEGRGGLRKGEQMATFEEVDEEASAGSEVDVAPAPSEAKPTRGKLMKTSKNAWAAEGGVTPALPELEEEERAVVQDIAKKKASRSASTKKAKASVVSSQPAMDDDDDQANNMPKMKVSRAALTKKMKASVGPRQPALPEEDESDAEVRSKSKKIKEKCSTSSTNDEIRVDSQTERNFATEVAVEHRPNSPMVTVEESVKLGIPDAQFEDMDVDVMIPSIDPPATPPSKANILPDATVDNMFEPNPFSTSTPAPPPIVAPSAKETAAVLDDSPVLFVPALATMPMKHIANLTDEERAMTVEQWIRHEMAQQYEQLKRDGERRIEAFKQRAREVRARIEEL